MQNSPPHIAPPKPLVTAVRIRTRIYWELIGLVLLVPVLASFTMIRLASYPTISGWDKGMYLQFASNLARYGEYATRNGDVFERLTPVGGTGITLIGPVALALAIAPQSLIAARMVIVVFLFIALLAVYLLTRRDNGWPIAVASTLLFLSAGATGYDTLWIGRQVLAEIPALAFLLFGIWAWFRSWQGGWGDTLVAIVLLAAAIVTKNQFVIALGPAFVLLAFCDWAYYRQLGWIQRIVPLAGILIDYLGWSVAAAWIVDPDARATYNETQRALMEATFIHVNMSRILESLRMFYKSGQMLIVVISIGYGLYRSRARSAVGLQRLVLPLVTSALLVAFVLISLPWPRYLYPALALAAPCIALMIGDLTAWIGQRRPIFAVIVIVGGVVLLAGPRLVYNAQQITIPADTSAAQFVALIEQHVPSDAIVANWEWELEFLADRRFVHPPNALFAFMVDSVYNQRNNPQLALPRIPAAAKYVVVGPFVEQTQAFAPDLAERNHELIGRNGSYKLYRLGK